MISHSKTRQSGEPPTKSATHIQSMSIAYPSILRGTILDEAHLARIPNSQSRLKIWEKKKRKKSCRSNPSDASDLPDKSSISMQVDNRSSSVITASLWRFHSLPAFAIACPFRVLLLLVPHKLAPPIRVVAGLFTPVRDPKQLVNPR